MAARPATESRAACAAFRSGFSLHGPLGGGWVFDRFGGYAWLYIGSFALGMGAVAIALAFPPITKRPLASAGQVQAGGA
jgi:hypothetical protein